MAIGKEGNVKWVDGLRGLASATVVLTHLARSFDLGLFEPSNGAKQAPKLLQWPFVRVLVQGRIGVAVFAMVTGYVCALKPIRLCRGGNQEAAFRAMGKSALRRVPRLVMPAALATVLAWTMAQLNLFAVARHSDSWWARATSVDYNADWGQALVDLVANLVRTWTMAVNAYDPNQWTMMPLLKGSMEVYVFMLATGYIRPRYRMLAAMAMWLFYYFAGDATFGMQFFFGVFLSELQNMPGSNQFMAERPRICRCLSLALLTSGLYLASYPEGHYEYKAWSRGQHALLTALLPSDANASRYATGLGLELVALGLHLSPGARDVLANRLFLWLGRQSFAVYLLHGPLLRSVLCWMVFGFHYKSATTNDAGETVDHWTPVPHNWRVPSMALLWMPLVYALAVAWTTYVDPWCAAMTERLVGHVLDDEAEKPQPLLPS